MNPPVITVDSAETEDHYEIEHLLRKRVSHWGCEYTTEYLIQWKGYRSEFDIWYNIKDLEKAEKLVKEYKKHTASEQKVILP